ncbi:MAG TPA: elongation factor G [Stellaceae bacterium]|nr:elongation factor G [Stellaceae bacterium]
MGERAGGPRVAALVGPYLSGKTTLLESLLFAAEAIHRRGTQKDQTTVGDSAPEARARQMSTEINPAHATYLGDRWFFLDCPGSVELITEAQTALLAADVAVVVCEAVPDRVLALSPLFKFLDDRQIPHMIFVNKIDQTSARVSEVLAALQSISTRPLVLRQVPLPGPDNTIAGYVDLVSERAYRYQPGKASDLIKLPDTMASAERESRASLVEKLADFDDKLLEQLLEDVQPSKDQIYGQLAKDLRHDLIVPVFLGSASLDHGVRRLWKALRHETPAAVATAERLGVGSGDGTVVQVIKTYNPPHAGKLSLARIWRGAVSEGMTLGGIRVGGVLRLQGAAAEKLSGGAGTGEIAALARLEGVVTGTVLATGTAPKLPRLTLPSPVFGLAITAEKRSDDVKLTGAIQKLIEEDPTLSLEPNPELQELVLCGQGDIHLQIALDRLRHKFNLAAQARRPQIPYRETIRKSAALHSRFKRQSGGHGQFADIQIEIKPLPRGGGFAFIDAVVGGAIPRNYIPAVEEGVKDYLRHGPFGNSVVDLSVKLITGQFHTVDSSDQAFKTVARQAMSEALPTCDPVLLEPIHRVEISVPNAFTSRVQRIVSARRGHILGYDAKADWTGWDVVATDMPLAEMHDLIIELRSVTLGTGTFTHRFDRLQELTGKLADKVLAARAGEAAQ